MFSPMEVNNKINHKGVNEMKFNGREIITQRVQCPITLVMLEWLDCRYSTEATPINYPRAIQLALQELKSRVEAEDPGSTERNKARRESHYEPDPWPFEVNKSTREPVSK